MVTTFGLCWWWWLCWTWCRRWWWWRPPVKDCGHIARVVVPLEAVLSRVPHPRLCNKYIWHGCHTRYIHIFPNALYDVIAYIFDSILQKKNIFLRLCSNNFWLYMRFTQFIKYWKSGNVSKCTTHRHRGRSRNIVCGNCETGRSGDRVRQNSNDDWLKCNCTGSGGSPLFGPIRTQNSVASIFLSAELFHSAHIEVKNGRQQWVLTCICLDFHSQLYMVHVYDLEHFHMYISLTTGVPWSLGQDKRGRG